jgi:diadenylate cyclase
MNSILSGKFAEISNTVIHFFSSISIKSNPFIIIDVIIVTILFYWVYLFLKETRAMRIIYGIIILAVIFLIGRWLNLSALNYILKYVITVLVVAIPIVFQPELRSGLEKLGRAEIVGDFSKLRRSKMVLIVQEISNAAELLSKNKIGALIVLSRQTGLREYIDTGVKMNADITTETIITVFTPKTPLHDGAMIISADKIVAAGCTLPLAEIQYDYNLGTRHRAAIGLSIQTDALVIVVSEERGMVSLASNGVLSKDITKEKLEELLIKLLRPKLDKNISH